VSQLRACRAVAVVTAVPVACVRVSCVFVSLVLDLMRQYMLCVCAFRSRLLSGVVIDSEAAAVRAMDMLHSLGVKAVVITSASLGDASHVTLFASVPWAMVVDDVALWATPSVGDFARQAAGLATIVPLS
jgi:hypothetical protein